MLVSKISKKGQVTIPKVVRESLRAKPGDWIEYEVQDNGVSSLTACPERSRTGRGSDHFRSGWLGRISRRLIMIRGSVRSKSKTA